jgi:transcriptional regulator with XRE-family HTH domain
MVLRMTQDHDLDGLVRKRIRGLRVALGWSLDDLGARCYLSPSTLSRIETGHRRISLDQLSSIARALGTTLDQLVESVADDDVVIRPQRDTVRGMTTWILSREPGPHGVTVAKMRITRPESRSDPEELKVHPGRDWFTVLSGTMIPHAFGASGGPAEVLGIFDHDGQRTHLRPLPPGRPPPAG